MADHGPRLRNQECEIGTASLPSTIATTGNSDGFITVEEDGILRGVDISGVDALAANDTNYLTFTVTNLGQAGSGTTAMLDSGAGNTTKLTGGKAFGSNARSILQMAGNLLNTNLSCLRGDRIRVRAAATGTLANTVTFTKALFHFDSFK